MIPWLSVAPAVTSAFLASLVEVVEAFTIILAVGTVSGWRPALAGAALGLVVLAALVLVFGPLLDQVPIHLLQFVIGVLLLLFGLRWLRKAILRASGIIALHDEIGAYAAQTAELEAAQREDRTRANWIAGFVAFKAVVIEGIEVVFIVLALSAGNGLLMQASLGALAAVVLVLVIGIAVHRPLAQVPENLLKFVVGVLLSSFGLFWTGEGLGVDWPGADLIILGFVAMYLVVSFAAVQLLRRRPAAGAAP